ncbi:MAG: glycosyltransferase family 2 protein [Caulobacter sp.]
MAIFRNEAHVLAEWIDHYLQFGVQHFYLINNRSDDGFEKVLAPYRAAGLVDLFDCDAEGRQNAAYAELLPLLTRETRWVGVFDLDEFIYPPNGGLISDVVESLSMYDAVLCPWLSFGSNGHLDQPRSVIDGFTKRGPAGVSRAFLKAISKPASIVTISQHNPVTRGPKILSSGEAHGNELFLNIQESELARFALVNNHYRLQSRNYFRTVKTGRPEVNEAVAGVRKAMQFFDENDGRWNQVVDTRLADLRRAWRASSATAAASPGKRA